ncbi:MULTISPECIES: heavy-metal-associated domain-containing protein [Tenacibaculum]|uniref:heavy-metal-associated domain-containing protein n=1 Tax=Tenacibaculum TaxID=104267 RepID=UPI00089B1B0C|nr:MULTISPECIES: heavy-metal-associated domain-containing protein [unclassified Tenacibaculum]RBW59203.1 copper chaperone [Tenacibaculum sp. E3R01]SEE10622.1 Copper chaperone CopZ [Tenacibaculum sp. MAR_2010_89]
MIQDIYIENLKCGGCAATIKKGLLEIDGVDTVTVDVEKSLIAVNTPLENLQKVKEKLSKLGYPEVGDKNTVLHKAKSFVSCATGKMSK